MGIKGRRFAERGFALLEVLLASTVLALAVVGMSGAIVSSIALQRSEIDRAAARQAARRAIEELQSVPFDETFRTYNQDTGDDAGLTVAARGPNFAVAGLEPTATDADGLCGRVEFPTITAGGSEELREDAVDSALGMPADLNSDGVVDALDHAGDYSILPVRVRVAWRGVDGIEQYDVETILCRR